MNGSVASAFQFIGVIFTGLLGLSIVLFVWAYIDDAWKKIKEYRRGEYNEREIERQRSVIEVLEKEALRTREHYEHRCQELQLALDAELALRTGEPYR